MKGGRVVNGWRTREFARRLVAWDWRALRGMDTEGNCARFCNEFRDIYDSCFPEARRKRQRRDVDKPWLDDHHFKELVREKEELFSRKVKGRFREGEEERLAEVTRQVNSARRRLKREYFSRRVGEVEGNMRATWGVLY